jgi:hypothetical protein
VTVAAALAASRTSTVVVPPQNVVLMLIGVCLGLLAGVKLYLVVIGLFSPFEHDYAESVVYDQAARLLHGQALYQPLNQPPFTVNPYTPLYAVLVAGLRAVLGDGFIWGRALSLVCGLTAAGCVARLTWRTAGSTAAALLAAVMYLALGFVPGLPWFGLYRVDTLGVALSFATIVVLAEGTSGKHVVLAGLLAGLAILTKQTFVAALLAGCVWLLWIDRRKAILLIGAALLLIGFTAAVLELTTGAFLANTVGANINPFRADLFLQLGGTFLSTQLLPLLLAIYYLLRMRPWSGSAGRLLVCYWAASALTLSGLGKVGAATNYWIEFAGSTSILATLGLWTAWQETRALRARFAPKLVLYAAMLYSLLIVSSGGIQSTLASATFIADWRREYGTEFAELIARIAREPREVLSEPMDVVVLANRPMLFEPLNYTLLWSANVWDAQPLVDRICAGEIGMLVLVNRIDELPQQVIGGYELWPPPLTTALQETMIFDSWQAGRFVYVPRPKEELARPRPGCPDPTTS